MLIPWRVFKPNAPLKWTHSNHKETVRLVRSGCPSLGAQQLELWMPESEVSVMKEVEPWPGDEHTYFFQTKNHVFFFCFFGCWGFIFGSPIIGISE